MAPLLGDVATWVSSSQAMERGLDTGMISAFYRVEDTAPCRVLELAGFVAAAETADTQSSRDVLYPQVCARMQAHAFDTISHLFILFDAYPTQVCLHPKPG